MPISKPNFDLGAQYVQLALELDLPEVEMEGVSPEEARRRSESMRAALLQKRGTDEQPGWFNDFESLLDGGWPWRQAVYIAWASIPRDNRVPKTQNDLAITFLGLTSDRAIATWRRRNPAIDEMIAVLQSAPLWEHRAEVYQALIRVAQQDDYKGHNDRKLFLELIGDYMPAAKLEAILRSSVKGSDVDAEDEDALTQIEIAANKMKTPRPQPPPSGRELR